MNNRKIALGPGAASLSLIVVVLALCMLSMLTLVTAKNDMHLAGRSAEMIRQVYELNSESERHLAELDAALVKAAGEAGEAADWLERVRKELPEMMTMEEDIVSWTETKDNRHLDCQVRVKAPGEGKRTEWVSHRLIVEEPEGDWEWD